MKTQHSEIRPQPDFPNVDISDHNADVLELILANESIVNQHTKELRLQSQMLRSGLVGSCLAMKQMAYNLHQQDAMYHGMRLFVATHGLVNAALERPDETVVQRKMMILAKGFGREQTTDYADEADVFFYAKMQRTADTIEAVANNFEANTGRYAVLGAALMHRFEFEATQGFLNIDKTSRE